MKLPLKGAFRIMSRLNLALWGRKYRFIFILGHMRSGSTLLAHILGSHLELVGAGESHISYQTPVDLPKLVLSTCETLHRPFLRETYIVDQINHDYLTDDVLRSRRVYRCVILLRDPEATLKSMLKLSIWSEDEALQIYTNRMAQLSHYGTLLGRRALLVEYDKLVDHSETTLSKITDFLDLNSPLTSIYATHRMTARVPGYGDPSPNIKVGRIVRTPEHDINISCATLLTAQRAFQNCRSVVSAETAQRAHKTSENAPTAGGGVIPIDATD